MLATASEACTTTKGTARSPEARGPAADQPRRLWGEPQWPCLEATNSSGFTGKSRQICCKTTFIYKGQR